MEVAEKAVRRSAMYLKLETRDRINMLKARFAPVLGRVPTQDDTLAILFEAWDARHDDSEAARYAGK